MKTPDEARKCWCPFAMALCPGHDPGTHFEVSYNRTTRGAPTMLARCIADECMAWRWVRVREFLGSESLVDTDKGYCGLAGKP